MAKSLSVFLVQCKFCKSFIELNTNEKNELKYECPICNQINIIVEEDIQITQKEYTTVINKKDLTLNKARDRGGCLTTYLFFILIGNLILLIFSVFTDEKTLVSNIFNSPFFGDVKIEKVLFLVKAGPFFNIINIVSIILLFNWRKFGFWLILIADIFNFFLSISAGLNPIFVFLTSFIRLIILTPLLINKWHLFNENVENIDNKIDYYKEKDCLQKEISNRDKVPEMHKKLNKKVFIAIIFVVVVSIIVSVFSIVQKNKSNDISIKDKNAKYELNNFIGVYIGKAGDNNIYIVINNASNNKIAGYNVVFNKVGSEIKTNFEGLIISDSSRIVIYEDKKSINNGVFRGSILDDFCFLGPWCRYSNNDSYLWDIKKTNKSENEIRNEYGLKP